MNRPARGLLCGVLCGLAASYAFAHLFDHMSLSLLPFMTPGAVGLGGLLGWATGRMGRFRAFAALPIGILCSYANVFVSLSIDRLAGDPLDLLSGHALHQSGLVWIGGIVSMWFSMFLVPTGLIAGTAVTLATWRFRPKPQLP